MTNGIHFHVNEDGLALLQVERLKARNALNWAAQEAFAQAVTAVAQTPHARALIITGSGDKAFVAGGDLKELAGHLEPEAGMRLNRVMSQALTQLTELPIPVIAAVNGDAFGGGCEILTACDLRLATPHARFSFAQVKVGLTSGWGGTARLVRLIGQSAAMELLLTGRLVEAAEAVHLGLIHRLVLAGQPVLDAARAWAMELMALPRQALANAKALAYLSAHANLAEAYAAETRLFTQLWASADHLEALAAFREKRAPHFNQQPGDETRQDE